MEKSGRAVAAPIGAATELPLETEATAEPLAEHDEEALQLIQDFAADQVSRMELTRPEVLRSVPAYVVLDKCAEALRGGQNKDCWYRRSQMTERVDAFWSHSWHGESWKKILTLLVLYSSTPAICAGMTIALLSTVLFAVGFLPGIKRIAGLEVDFCCWGLVSGAAVSIVTFLLWRPRQRVFFDRICIHQSDGDLKTASILSLAGILKQSDTMLVLWDSSYNERLWCLFELAAFLKSKDLIPDVLIIKPTFIGPTAILIFLGVVFGLLPLTLAPVDQFMLLPASGIIVCFGAGQYLALASMRSYFRSIEEMSESLKHLRIDNTKSTCCKLRHIDEDGTQLICDRKVVQGCIKAWFGSHRGFEEIIQTEVQEVLVRQLRSLALPYKWRLGICVPVFWACLDLVATTYRLEDYNQAFYWTVTGFLMWLVAGPLTLQYAVFLARTFCAKQSGWRDVLRNFFVILLGLPALMLLVTGFLVLWFAIADPMQRAAVLAAGALLSLCVVWCLRPQRSCFVSQVSPHPIEMR